MSLAALRDRFSWPDQRPAVPENRWGWLNALTRDLLDRYLLDPDRPAPPSLVVELGSWLGESATHIVGRVPETTLICVDHWQGAPAHYTNPEWCKELPTLYETFLRNLWSYRERVIPLKADTLDGLAVVADVRLTPDLVFLDATHTTEQVLAELRFCDEHWPATPLVGDDYSHEPVREAAELFAVESGRKLVENGIAFALEARS